MVNIIKYIKLDWVVIVNGIKRCVVRCRVSIVVGFVLWVKFIVSVVKS